MRTAVVKASEIAAQPGMPLNAAYWIGRNEGETYEEWQRRTTAAAHIATARRHMQRAARSLARAEEIMKEEI